LLVGVHAVRDDRAEELVTLVLLLLGLVVAQGEIFLEDLHAGAGEKGAGAG